jgi:hypothetical protein
MKEGESESLDPGLVIHIINIINNDKAVSGTIRTVFYVQNGNKGLLHLTSIVLYIISTYFPKGR